MRQIQTFGLAVIFCMLGASEERRFPTDNARNTPSDATTDCILEKVGGSFMYLSAHAGDNKIRQLAVVIPVLDDWPCFSTLVIEISNEFSGSEIEIRIYAVDDGSVTPFDPATLALPPGSPVVGVEILHLALNLGHQRAIAVGLCAVAGCKGVDAVVVMDSDGEDRPGDIAALLAASAQHLDHIVLARRARRSEPLGFKLWYIVYKLVFYVLTGQAISFGNYSLLPIAAVRRLVHMPELWNNLPASIMRSRLRYQTIPIERGSRYHGRSRMNLASLIVHGLSAMSVYTDLIFVRMLLAAGCVAVLTTLGIIAVAMTRLLTDVAIPGWATTAIGDLIIIQLQAVLIIIAASLMMLAGRSSRPIIPIVDARQFLSGRERCRIGQDLTELSNALPHD